MANSNTTLFELREQQGTISLDNLDLIYACGSNKDKAVTLEELGNSDAISSKLKNDINTNTTAGAIPAGTQILKGSTLDQLFRMLTVAYIAPSFSSFTANFRSDRSSQSECGETLLGPLTFSWTYGNERFSFENIAENSLEIRNDNSEGVVVKTGLAKATKSFTSEIKNLIFNTPTTKKYYIKGEDIKGTVFANTTSHSWVYKCFYGYTTTATKPTVDQMRSANWFYNPINNSQFTVSTPVGGRITWFTYPATLRNPSSIIALDSMKTEVKDAFTVETITFKTYNGTNVSYKFVYKLPDAPQQLLARYQVTI